MADSAEKTESGELIHQPKGRPRAKMDPESLFNLARIGLDRSTIADFFGVSRSTLQRRLSEEEYAGAFTEGQANLKQMIAAKLVREGLVNNNTACLLKLSDYWLGTGKREGKPPDMDIEVKGAATVKLRWTEEMDADFEETVAHIKEHGILDVEPVQDGETEEPTGSPAISGGEVPDGG